MKIEYATKVDNMAVAQHLENLFNGNVIPNNNYCGLCAELRTVFKIPYEVSYAMYWDWEPHSGVLTDPVGDFDYTGGKFTDVWHPHTDRGKKRLQLCAFVAYILRNGYLDINPILELYHVYASSPGENFVVDYLTVEFSHRMKRRHNVG